MTWIFSRGLCIGRNLTESMGMDGSVWWDPTLGVFSHTVKGVSYILHWRLSTFSSSRELLHLPLPLPLEEWE